MPCLGRSEIEFRPNQILSILHVNVFAFFCRRKIRTVSFRKFVIKAFRSMIMAFVLVFVIFAKATVAEFPDLFVY